MWLRTYVFYILLLKLILNKTNFYAEQGGQIGDSGIIATDTGLFIVETTKRLGNSILLLSTADC